MKTTSLDITSLDDFAKVSYSLKDVSGQTLDTPFDQGEVSFVINGGGYASYVHDTASALKPGESKTEKVSVKLFTILLICDDHLYIACSLDCLIA